MARERKRRQTPIWDKVKHVLQSNEKYGNRSNAELAAEIGVNTRQLTNARYKMSIKHNMANKSTEYIRKIQMEKIDKMNEANRKRGCPAKGFDPWLIKFSQLNESHDGIIIQVKDLKDLNRMKSALSKDNARRRANGLNYRFSRRLIGDYTYVLTVKYF